VPPEVLAAIAELEAQRVQLAATLALATEERDRFAEERDRYKELYVKQLELCRKLELGKLCTSRRTLPIQRSTGC
jgi:hypothetical protein